MNDEYTETKVRVYKTKAKKEESAVSKYLVNPMVKMVSGGKWGKNEKTRRLTA